MRRHHTQPLSQRTGISLVEVLVSLAIIGLLLALVLPAVQSSREAARRIQCVSHLKQLATATSSYASTHSVYPPSGGLDQPSFFVRLLPYIEQESLFRQFDLAKPMSEQRSLAVRRPTILVCPSDGVAGADQFMRSFGGNMGWFVADTSAALPGQASLNGVITFLNNAPVNPDHVFDGLSNTAMISEMLPSGNNRARQLRWNETPSGPVFRRPVELLATDCLAAMTSYAWARGSSWTDGGASETLYDHVLPPNSRMCNWVYGADSIHSGRGVNVALCDGTVRFVSESIDVNVWRAIGSRNGKEVYSLH